MLVALALLGLLTLGAMGLARGTLRETLIAGTRRPGEQVRALAEGGLEAALVAMEGPPPRGPLAAAVRQIQGDRDGSLTGVTAWVPPGATQGQPLPGGEETWLELGFTRMARIRPFGSSIRPEGSAPGLGQGGAADSQVLRIQARSVMRVGGALTFRSQAEAWVVDAREVEP